MSALTAYHWVYRESVKRWLIADLLILIFADTRTNAGVDNVSTFRKLHVFTQPGHRIMAIASAGNLSISQSVVSMLREGWENPETGETETLMNAPTMFQAAQSVGAPSGKFTRKKAARWKPPTSGSMCRS